MVDWVTSVEDSTVFRARNSFLGAVLTFVPQKLDVIVEGPFKREHYGWVWLPVCAHGYVLVTCYSVSSGMLPCLHCDGRLNRCGSC